MKNYTLFYLVTLFFFSINASSQTKFNDIKAGHVFFISLPDYMSRTTGLNDVATFQFKNSVKDVYGIIIEDNKEELKLAEMMYSSSNEFYEDFIKSFLVDEKNRTVNKSVSKKIGTVNYTESGASYLDEEIDAEIYYFIGIVETSSTFHKLICWCSIEDKDKYIPDFQKILYSIKD